MPTYYCSTSGCGNRIEYLTEKPKACPKCKASIVDPLKALALATASAARVPIRANPEEDDLEVVTPPVRSAKSKAIIRKPLTRLRPVVHLETDDQDGTNDEDIGEEDEDGEPLDPRAARRLARELAATIDPSTIHVGIDDSDERVTFGKWCAGG